MFAFIKPRRETGFTLLEITIVILIIGLLAVIAIPIYSNQVREAALATLNQDLKATAIDVGVRQNGDLKDDVLITNEQFNAFKSESENNTLELHNFTRPSGKIEYCVEGTHTFSSTDKVVRHYNLTTRAVGEGPCVASGK